MVTVTTLKRPNLANMPTLILSISYWFNIKNSQDINSAITKKHLLKTAHVHLRRCNVSIQPWGWRSVILMTRKVTSFAHFMKSRTQLSFEVLESFSACYLLYVVTPCGPPTQLFGFTAGWEQWAHPSEALLSFRLLSIISVVHVHDGGHQRHTRHSD